MTNSQSIVLDVAGARIGGAARYLGQLRHYLKSADRPDVHLIGEDSYLTPMWVLRRERIARARSRVALNNLGFFGGRRRVTLLRNALHFATAEEFAAVQWVPGATFKAQVALVRGAALRSDLLVVPCQAMADRVVTHMPGLRGRILVRHHPMGQAEWAHDERPRRPIILVPVIAGPYKRLEGHLSLLLRAVELTGRGIEVQMTNDGASFPSAFRDDPRLRFVGQLDSEQLDALWRDAAAVYFPTQIESFGYPLAEARVNGVPILALDTAQSNEIAGAALRGFRAEDVESLAAALIDAFERRPLPDSEQFDPTSYFDWLLEVAS